MFSRRWRKNEAGLTMLELMVAMGLASIVTYAVFSFYADFSKRLHTISEEVEGSTDIEAAQRILLRDLRGVDPSYGVLTLRDDRGKAFFEYFPDLPDDAIYPGESDREAAVERVYTMRHQTGYFKSIVFMLLDTDAHPLPSLIYDPTWAFTITPGADFFTEGTVTWDGLNAGSRLSTLRETDLPDHKGYWNNGQLLLLDTPLLFRPKSLSAIPTDPDGAGNVPPRAVSFLGRVNGSNSNSPFVPLTMADALADGQTGDAVDTRHPVETSQTIVTAENFFRWLPSAGGGQPMVRLRPVKLVKYYLNRDDKGIVSLWKHVYTQGQWNQGRNHFMIAHNVKTVQFKRPTVGDKAILFNISRNELKKGGEP